MENSSLSKVNPFILFWLGLLTGAIIVGLIFAYQMQSTQLQTTVIDGRTSLTQPTTVTRTTSLTVPQTLTTAPTTSTVAAPSPQPYAPSPQPY